MKLYLIRHGETDWNKQHKIQGCEDIPLNEEGRVQVARVADSVLAYDPEIIWTSPLSRARESGAIIADRCGVQSIRVLDGLTERDFGESGGMTFDYRREHYPDEENIPGQEPFINLQKRALAALDHIVTISTAQSVLIVSHGAFIDSVLRHFTNTPWQGLSSIKLKNCSVSFLEYTDDVFSLVWKDR